MTFAIEILPAARRELEALDATVRRRIDRKIALLAANPRASGSKKLEGHDLMRVRVAQSKAGRRRMKDYHINIFQSDEDGGYIADIPDLPHCCAFGETPEKALEEVLKAKAAWLDAAKEAGKPIPPPSFKPAIYQVA